MDESECSHFLFPSFQRLWKTNTLAWTLPPIKIKNNSPLELRHEYLLLSVSSLTSAAQLDHRQCFPDFSITSIARASENSHHCPDTTQHVVQQNTRPPQGVSAPFSIVKMPFGRMKAILFSKYRFYSSQILIFPTSFSGF